MAKGIGSRRASQYAVARGKARARHRRTYREGRSEWRHVLQVAVYGSRTRRALVHAACNPRLLRQR